MENQRKQHENTSKSFLREHTGPARSQNWTARALILGGILLLGFSAVLLQRLPPFDKLRTSLFSGQTLKKSENLWGKMSGKRNVGYFVS